MTRGYAVNTTVTSGIKPEQFSKRIPTSCSFLLVMNHSDAKSCFFYISLPVVWIINNYPPGCALKGSSETKECQNKGRNATKYIHIFNYGANIFFQSAASLMSSQSHRNRNICSTGNPQTPKWQTQVVGVGGSRSHVYSKTSVNEGQRLWMAYWELAGCREWDNKDLGWNEKSSV